MYAGMEGTWYHSTAVFSLSVSQNEQVNLNVPAGMSVIRSARVSGYCSTSYDPSADEIANPVSAVHGIYIGGLSLPDPTEDLGAGTLWPVLGFEGTQPTPQWGFGVQSDIIQISARINFQYDTGPIAYPFGQGDAVIYAGRQFSGATDRPMGLSAVVSVLAS